jgi:hypothetical protein
MSERTERNEAKTTALRITNQFRSKGGMAYDLKCDGVRLTLHVSGRTGSDDPGEWRVEARGGRATEDVVTVVQWGATRTEALRAVAKSWADELATDGLRVFDWEAVAQALSSVRAL